MLALSYSTCISTAIMYIPSQFKNNRPVLIKRERLPEKYHKLFSWDGGESNFGHMRSVWFDHQVNERARSITDISQNILRVPQGSADMFFDNAMVERIRTRFCRRPDCTFDIAWAYGPDGRVKDAKGTIQSKGKMKWWGELSKNRPPKDHNFIVACDISYGRGASNSVIAICDVNNTDIAGMIVDPFMSITDLADLAVALCQWLNGAFLIWESNGPGNEFDHRVRFQRYPRVYIPRVERQRIRSTLNKRGWQSTPGVNGSKLDMLNRLDAALMESLREQPTGTFIILHDDETTRELDDYIFDVHKIDVNPSNSATDSSGARYAHGDRVIAVGMALLALEREPKAVTRHTPEPPVESVEFRMREDNKRKSKEKSIGYRRQYLY